MNDFFNFLVNILMLLVALIPYRKYIKKKIREIYENPYYRPVNNIIAAGTAIFLVVSYFIVAMLFWILKFKASEAGFYICIGGTTPVIAFALFFYRINYMPKL